MKKEIKERIEMINNGEVPEGYKETKLGIIPEDWEIKKNDEFIDFKGGYAFSSKKMSAIKGEFQLIKMSNVYKGNLSLDRSPSYWDKPSENEKEYILKKGDIVLTLTGTVGKRDYGYSVMIENSDKYLLNQRLTRIRMKKNLSYFKYIKYLVSSERFLYDFFSVSKGGTGNQSNVSIKSLREIKSYFPNINEQTQIANILQTWDKAIELKENLLEKKKDIKKGLMQNLLTGKVRLDGFDDEWEEIRLGKIINVEKRTGRKSSHGNDQGKYPFFTNNTDDHIFYVDEFDYSGEYIIANTGGQAYFDNYSGKFSCMNDNLVFSVEHDYLFIYYLLKKQERFIDYLGFAGSGLKHLDKRWFKKVKFNLPNLLEQKAIAEIISKADESIELLEKEIKSLREQKKGLMQLLLTGKVRVNEMN